MSKEDFLKKQVECYTKFYAPCITNEPPKKIKKQSAFGEIEETVLSDKYSVTLHFIQRTSIGADIEFLEQIEESRREKDFESVNNCIFQKERTHILNIYDGWYSDEFLSLLEAYACGDGETVEQTLPKELELCEYGYDFYVAGCNITRAMHYRDEDLFEQIEPQIEKFINGKAAKWERSAIAFLYAVVKGEFEKTGIYLLDMCKSYRRVSLAGASKKFCIYAHGIYCIAMEYLSEKDLKKIELPDIDNFDKGYAHWRKKYKDIKPKAYYIYPENMNLVNKAFELPVPKMSILREEGRWGHLIKNTEDMKNQFVQWLKEQEQQENLQNVN